MSSHVNISKVSNCEKLLRVGFEPTTSGLQDQRAYLLRQQAQSKELGSKSISDTGSVLHNLI